MKSPFPGMDPYLEPHWLDVHASLAIEARNALNTVLPDDLVALVEKRTVVASADDGEVEHGYRPDVLTFESPAGTDRTIELTGGGAVAAPIKLVVELEPANEWPVRVVAAGTERLVTVVEFVSPSNKRGQGLHDFRRKRREMLSSGVSFVEVDLIRAGDWEALMAPHRCPRDTESLYRVTIRVPGESRAAYLYPAPLRAGLPAVQVPLRPSDPVIMLDLQPLLDRTYAGGRYGRQIDYRADPKPPLDAEDATWANDLLRAAGRR